MKVAFYCVCDERYFLGAVAMINSLRLHGHDEPVYLLDLGLSAEQRELLAREVTLVATPPGRPPWLAKTVAPLAHPAEVMVLIDADMIVTRPLTELIETAREGRVVAFENHEERWVDGWGALLGLGPLERRPYLSSGLIALAREPGLRVLELIDAHKDAVDFEATFWRRRVEDYPFRYADQDLFNAVLAATVPADRVRGLDRRLAAPLIFDDPEPVDLQRLACRHGDGTEPYVVHHLLPAKPWLRPMHEGIYTLFLRRLLCESDLAIDVPARMLPLRLRPGVLAGLERRRVAASVRVRFAVGTRIDRWLYRLGLPPRDPVPKA